MPAKTAAVLDETAADTPVPAEPDLEAVAPEPTQGKVYMADGQTHLVADRDEIVTGLEGADVWLTLTRVNGSIIVVAKSAIVAYEVVGQFDLGGS